MAARSAGFRSDHRRAASARDHGGEAEFAASDSYRGRHDNHAWCRKFERPIDRRLENPVAKRDFGPADGERRTRTADTTIFSRYVLAAEWREIPGNQAARRVGLAPLILAICAGFHAFQGMAGVPSPFGRAVCSGGEPEIGALARRADPHGSERQCQFGRGARSSFLATCAPPETTASRLMRTPVPLVSGGVDPLPSTLAALVARSFSGPVQPMVLAGVALGLWAGLAGRHL